jgi:hypothetical protein
MTAALPLRVPLQVRLAEGLRWSQLKYANTFMSSRSADRDMDATN